METAGPSPAGVSPRPESKPSSQPITNLQDWSCAGAIPRLSEVVPGWHDGGDGLENQAPLDGHGGSGGGGEGVGRIPPHRRRVVRTRAAPAGPHPYLDRFASGMHKPLEG